ncbi:metallophosphoesterase [Microcoleus sp. bin48.metabat.b7b8b9.023]|uniref:metallophosphoesterase n=1 Tax=Microcoleus sp. bin48.metabat.b7b8b9.023 TaxID=2742710 RepID=UPI0025F3036D|nr:metallophosphoesterase [Microcoleus sp. bin48.metabat.b7b8b9.023]
MNKKYLIIAFIVFVSIASFGILTYAQDSGDRPFEFALIGDLPYSAEQEAKFPNLIADINRSPATFVVHDGDIKNGYTVCDDAVFIKTKQLFEKFEIPFILTYGDNDWTDCHRSNNGSYDPVERLAKLREIFSKGTQSLGKRTLTLTRQSENPQFAKYRENVRWTYHGIVFLAINMPGSNNNFGRTPEQDKEYVDRNFANLAWIKESFTSAKRSNSKGIILIAQANPGFELDPANKRRSGYNDFIATLEAETRNFPGQVVFVHGDTHYFRIDKPLPRFDDDTQLPRLQNFTRVETFGSPNVHWLRATYDPKSPNVFEFQQRIVP